MAEYNLGTARGRIVLDADGLTGGVDKARGAMSGLKSDLSGTTGFFQGVANDLRSVGERITRFITTGLKAATIAVGGLVTASLWGGLNRVLDTEDARVQMERMGLATKDVDNLLEAVDKTFEGTPFANPDGFNISSQLFASNVELDRVPGILGNIADFAAHANVDINRMGDMFVRIASQGRVTGQELMSLAQMGIPIATLADSMGLTVDELREMTSAGEFTSDMFFEAADNIEMFEGAAKAMGSTTRGAFSNIRTALSVLGDKFLSPLFGQDGYAVQAMQAIREAIRGLFPAAEQAGEAFARWLVPAIERASAWFQNSFVPAVLAVIDVIKDVISWLKENREVIQRILAAVAPAAAALAAFAVAFHLVSKVIRAFMLASPVGIILAIASALVYAWQNSETFRSIVTTAFEAVKTIVLAAVEWFKRVWQGAEILRDIVSESFRTIRSVIQGVLDFVIGLVQTVVGWFQNMGQESDGTASFISQVWEKVGSIFETLGEIVGVLLERFRSTFEAIRTIIQVWSEFVGAQIQIVMGFIQAFWDWIEPIWTAIWDGVKRQIEIVWELIQSIILNALDFIQGILDIFLGIISGDWSKAWEGIKKVFGAIWDTIVSIGEAFVNTIENYITTFLQAVIGFWTNAWNKVRNFFQNTWNSLVSWFRSIPNRVINAVVSLISKANSWANNVMASMRNRFVSMVNSLISWFTQLPGRVISAITGLIARATRWARDVIQSMRKAFVERVQNLINWFRQLPGRITGAIPNPGSMLTGIGRRIIQGLIDGIRGMADRVKNAVNNVLDSARRLLPFSPAKEGPFSGRGWTLHSGRALIRALAEGIKREEQGALKAALSVVDSVSDIMSSPDFSSAVQMTATATPMITGSRNTGENFVFQFDFSNATFGDGSPDEIRRAVTSTRVLEQLTHAARAGRRS